MIRYEVIPKDPSFFSGPASNAVLCDLVRTQTEDGIRLDGAFYSHSHAASPAAESRGILIFLHGAGSNFYGGAISETLAEILPAAGWSVLRANTRGHDGVFAATRGGVGVRQGAAYEIIDESRLDCSAWVEWANSQSNAGVILAGHSLGAIKAIYAVSKASLNLAGLIAVSPPRLSRAAFQYGPQSSEFMATLAEAEVSVRDGQGERLIESPFPFPMLITCRTFVDKYGGEQYNILEHVPAIQSPALFVFGERELAGGGVAFAGLDKAVSHRATTDLLEVRVVANADHFYQGVREPLGQTIHDWLATLRNCVR